MRALKPIRPHAAPKDSAESSASPASQRAATPAASDGARAIIAPDAAPGGAGRAVPRSALAPLADLFGDSPTQVRAPEAASPVGSFEIFTDGAAVPNPGKGGWGFVAFRDGLEVERVFGGLRDTTNNVMEMTAVMEALRWLGGRPATVRSDSQYVVKGLNEWRAKWRKQGWQVKNADLWMELDALATASAATFVWVKGHVGIEGNEIADGLAMRGIESLGRRG